KWHDGQTMTADDVLYSLQTWTDAEKAPEPRRSAGGLIKSVEKVDGFTVKVTIKQPSINFLQFMAFQRNVYIAPKHVEDLSKTVTGTGPFKVVKAELDNVVVVERNPDFYLPNKPHLDGGKVFQSMERGAQQAAFIAKGLDLINVGDQAQFDALKKLIPADVKTTSYLQNHGVSLYMKFQPPFDDIRVRRAMHLAVDREGLLKTVTFGAGAINPPGGLALHGFSIPLDELKKLPGWRQPKDEDIAEAKKLLAAAGYPDGFKTTLQTARDRTTARPIMEAVGPMLKNVGIDAEIRPLERAVFLDNQRKGDFEVQVDLIHSDPPTQNLLTFYHSKGSLNKAPINDPELDKMIEEQDATLDPKRSGEINQNIQRYVLEKLYSIPTVEVPSFSFWQPWFNNYNLSFSAQPYIPQWDDLWMDPEKGYPKDRTLER
ncbi:MAG: ABC transporter substrate-binding protein, partial [Chloroflexi bacterium]|nr:ABC transporter substrate-binding protein [Chloroflexota bacterium]